MLINMEPYKYTLITSYKVLNYHDEYSVFNFYKYTGVYLFSMRIGHYLYHHFFDSEETCLSAINVLKTRFYAKKRSFLKNKKHNIELSPDLCILNCLYCEPHLKLRNELWDENNGWINCEKYGIKLKTNLSHTCYDNTILTCEFNENEYLKSVDEFIHFINNSMIPKFLCDCCDKSFAQNNIYFCNKCLEIYNSNDKLFKDDSESWDPSIDVYNLCHSCYTHENISKHVNDNDQDSDHECFIISYPYECFVMRK